MLNRYEQYRIMYIQTLLSHPLTKRFLPLITFCLLGSFNTMLSFTLFTVFWKLFHLNYLIATSITYITTATVQFFGNRSVTFKGASGNLSTQMGKYFIMLGTNYIVTVSIVHINVAFFHWSPYIGMLCATACTATLSFILFKFWIFRHNIKI